MNTPAGVVVEKVQNRKLDADDHQGNDFPLLSLREINKSEDYEIGEKEDHQLR